MDIEAGVPGEPQKILMCPRRTGWRKNRSLASSHRPDRCWQTLKSIDGRYWQFTAVLLNSGALSLVVLFQERGFLEGRDDAFLAPRVGHPNAAVKEILETLLLLFFAALVGVVAFLMLKSNFESSVKRDVQRRQASYWMFGGFIAILVADVLTVFNLIGAQNAYHWKQHEGRLTDPFSHYFLLTFFVLSMLITNIMFFCVLCRQFLNEEQDRRGQGRRDLSERMLVKAATGVSTSLELPHCGWKLANRLESMYNWMVTMFINIASYFATLVDTSNQRASRQFQFLCGWDIPISQILTGVFQRIVDLPVFGYILKLWTSLKEADCCGVRTGMLALFERARNAQPPTASKRLLGLKGILERKDKIMAKWNAIRPSIEDRFRNLWEDVREDEQYTHSAWLKGATATAFILLVYFGILITASLRYFLRNTYFPQRECLVNNDTYIRFCLRLLGFGGANLTPLPTYTPEVLAERVQKVSDRLAMNLTEDYLYDCKTGDSNLDIRLTVISLVEKMMTDQDKSSVPFGDSLVAFRASDIGKLILSIDIIFQKMSWTMYVGLVVGLLCGFYSLLSVLAQYKRISLAVRAGYFDALIVDQERRVVGTDKVRYLKVGEEVFESKDWSEVVAAYPMSSTMFFFGILVSTAVLQLVVFGCIITLGLAILTSIIELYPLMNQFMALLIAFGVTWFLNDVFSQWVFGEGVLQSKYKVYRESGFVLFLLVYSMVHLVLGIFFALSRLVMLVLSSLVSLNRLDRNIYTYNKGLDQGHRSFVATVLFHAAFDVSIRQPSRSESCQPLMCGEDPPGNPGLPAGSSRTARSAFENPMELQLSFYDADTDAGQPCRGYEDPPSSAFSSTSGTLGAGLGCNFISIGSSSRELSEKDEGNITHRRSSSVSQIAPHSMSVFTNRNASVHDELTRTTTQPLLHSVESIGHELISLISLGSNSALEGDST